MSNYREKMREYLKEPNEYSNQYGKWSALNSEQRQLIGRLLNEMDNADIVIKKQYEEKQQLISFLEDKINMCDDVIDTTKSDLQETQFTFNCKKALEDTLEKNELAKNIFQEVLDFVNKGGKDETK